MAHRKTAESMTVDEALLGDEERPMAGYDPASVGDDGGMSDDLALQASLQQIGETNDGASVIVYQINERTKKDVFLYKCGVSEFAATGLDEIQSRYGAGDYRIRVYAPGNGRGTGLLAHRRLSIGAPRMAVAVAPSGAPTQGLEAFMIQQQAAMMAGFREIAAAMAANHAPAAPQGMGVAETISLITALQGLTGRQAPPPDPLDMISKIVALQRDIMPPATNANGEIDSGAVLMKAIDAFGKPIAEMMAQQKSRQPPAVPVVQNPALPAPMAQAVIEQEPSEMDMKIAVFKGPLLVMAQQNADTYAYANMLLDLFSPEEIGKYIEAADWREQLHAVIPEAANFPEWFGALRETVLELLREPSDGDSVPTVTTTETP